jgi:hypothetical protein
MRAFATGFTTVSLGCHPDVSDEPGPAGVALSAKPVYHRIVKDLDGNAYKVYETVTVTE